MGLYLDTDPPETVPIFAEGNLVDPDSGLNNVIEPPYEQKTFGWIPSRKVPQRGVMNWLHRYTGRWCSFLKDYFFPEVDGGLDDHEDRILDLEHKAHWHTAGIVYLQMQVTNGYFSNSSPGGILTEDGRINFELDYQILENSVLFTHKEWYDFGNWPISENYSYIGGAIVAAYSTCYNFKINIRPGYDWPSDILPSYNYSYFLGSVLCAGSSEILPVWLQPRPQNGLSGIFLSVDCPATSTGQVLGLNCCTIIRGFTI